MARWAMMLGSEVRQCLRDGKLVWASCRKGHEAQMPLTQVDARRPGVMAPLLHGRIDGVSDAVQRVFLVDDHGRGGWVDAVDLLFHAEDL